MMPLRGESWRIPATNGQPFILIKKLHRILRLKAAETHRSISAIVNDAVRRALMEDAEDLAAYEARESEPTLTYEEMLKALKADGTL